MLGLLENLNNVFNLVNGGRIKISDNALQTMKSYCQDRPDKTEAGGVLIGRFIKFSKDIVVDEVTVPMYGDIRTANTFKRSLRHQEIVNKEWQESGQTLHYLGEWHSHPEPDPTPSFKDLCSWKKKLLSATFSSRYLYFIIIGTEKFGIWEGDRRTLKINRILKNGKKEYSDTSKGENSSMD